MLMTVVDAAGKSGEPIARRLIMLIDADWLPQDKLFIGSCLVLTARIDCAVAL